MITIEVTIITIAISVVSVSAAIFFGLKNNKRNETEDIKNDVAAMATVLVKLDNISLGINEIKTEMQNIKADQKADHDKLIEVIESTKQAHKRINDIIDKGKTNGI